MRKFNKTIVITLAMAASLAVFAGCGDSKKTESGSLDSNSQTGQTGDSADMTMEEYIDLYAKNVTLGTYKGIIYSYAPKTATDEQVQEQIDSFVASCASYDEDHTSAAKTGDTVNIDFVGSVDGVEFEGGNTNGQGYELTLGSGAFIDDFEDQIAGHKPGETFDVNVTFPEDYGKDDLNGKDALFKTTLNYIEIPKEAVYNDDLVAANTNFSNTADYEESVREQINATNEATELAAAQNLVMTAVINNATISSILEDEVNSTADQLIENIKASADAYQIDYLTYITYYYGYDDEEEFYEYVKQVCAETVKEKMVVCAIAKAENITVTEDEINAYINQIAAENNTDADSVKENYTEQDLMYYTLADKIMTFLLDNGVNEGEGTTEEDTAKETESSEETSTEAEGSEEASTEAEGSEEASTEAESSEEASTASES